MEYLLSDGRVTKDVITYIKDMIIIDMTLKKNDIPYYKGGSDELIPDLLTDNLITHVNNIVSDILLEIRSSFQEAKLSIVDTTIDNSTITVKISINDIIESIYIYPKE